MLWAVPILPLQMTLMLCGGIQELQLLTVILKLQQLIFPGCKVPGLMISSMNIWDSIIIFMVLVTSMLILFGWMKERNHKLMLKMLILVIFTLMKLPVL